MRKTWDRASLCALQKTIEDLRDMFSKGLLIHLHSFSIARLHRLESHCLLPVDCLPNMENLYALVC